MRTKNMIFLKSVAMLGLIYCGSSLKAAGNPLLEKSAQEYLRSLPFVSPRSLSLYYPCQLFRWFDTHCMPTSRGYLKTSTGDSVISVKIPEKPWLAIRFPFAEDHPAMCTQGNASLPDRTHFYSNTLYAVDLASLPDSPAGKLYAVFSGKALVEDGCTHAPSSESGYTPGCQCGGGFGNNVRIVREDGTYALYGHLTSICIKHGDTVVEGQCIGTEGSTGAAGIRHVHFSINKCYDPMELEMWKAQWDKPAAEIWRTPGWSIPFVFHLRYEGESSYRPVGSLDLEVSDRPFYGQDKI
jgi:hypothetical protein